MAESVNDQAHVALAHDGIGRIRELQDRSVLKISIIIITQYVSAGWMKPSRISAKHTRSQRLPNYNTVYTSTMRVTIATSEIRSNVRLRLRRTGAHLQAALIYRQPSKLSYLRHWEMRSAS